MLNINTPRKQKQPKETNWKQKFQKPQNGNICLTYLNTEKLGIVNVGPNDCISLERVVEIIGNVSGIYKPIKYQATGEKFSKMRIADSVITRHSSNSISRAVEQILEKE